MMNLLRKRVACSSLYDDSTWPSSSSSVACVHLRYAFASELNFFNVLCSPWSKVKWIPCGSSDRLVKMVSETLASNCTACMCEGLSESINNRIFWLPCQNHNGVSRAIYSAIKVKCFSQSLWTPSGQWSHRHGEITQYAIPLTEDNARNCISFSFFWVCERNRNGDNPSLFTGKWWKQKRFYFQFSSIVFQPLQASKVNGSQSAINVKHTKRADKKCECMWRGGEKRCRWSLVASFRYLCKPLSIRLHIWLRRSKFRLLCFAYFTIRIHVQTLYLYEWYFGVRASCPKKNTYWNGTKKKRIKRDEIMPTQQNT